MQKMMELQPNGRQKSFYGKAKVYWNPRAGMWILRSYNTDVCGIDVQGKIYRFWDDYSATTMKHVNAFCTQFGIPALSKRDWENLPVDREILVRYHNFVA